MLGYVDYLKNTHTRSKLLFNYTLYLVCKMLDVSVIIFEVTVSKVSVLKMYLPSLRCLNNSLKSYVLKLGKN